MDFDRPLDDDSRVLPLSNKHVSSCVSEPGSPVNIIPGAKIDPKAQDAVAAVIANRPANLAPHLAYLKLTWVCSLLYVSIVTAIKLSILLMYHRLFYIDDTFRRQSMAVGIAVLAFWLAGTITLLYSYRPLPYKCGVLSMNVNEDCFNMNMFWMVLGAAEVVIDTLTLALPVRVVLGMDLSRKRKFSVVCVFLLGGLWVLFLLFCPYQSCSFCSSALLLTTT